MPSNQSRWRIRKGEQREGPGEYGAEGQNRTVDTGIFSAVLYQLSYLGLIRSSRR